MLDSPRLFLWLSTWYFFCWMGLGEHPETYLLKALCCQTSPSWLKVMGGWWPRALYCHLLGLGVLSLSQSQSQSLDNIVLPDKLSCYQGCNFHPTLGYERPYLIPAAEYFNQSIPHIFLSSPPIRAVIMPGSLATLIITPICNSRKNNIMVHGLTSNKSIVFFKYCSWWYIYGDDSAWDKSWISNVWKPYINHPLTASPYLSTPSISTSYNLVTFHKVFILILGGATEKIFLTNPMNSVDKKNIVLHHWFAICQQWKCSTDSDVRQ